MRVFKRFFYLWVFAASVMGLNAADAAERWKVAPSLRTAAEQSDYRATSSSPFVVEFVKAVDQKAEHITHFEFGKTFEKRPMIAARVASPPFSEEASRDDDRLVVLINANIHSGECCGKEAMLKMLRELAMQPDHPWLQKLVLIVVPNYNADGNAKVAQDNRHGQVGPVDGMGVHANAQQLDLNREYVKLESPEARALIGLMNRFQPDCFMDLHTTNGSWHRYQLTYDVVHNPAADVLLRDFMRQEMMPAVTRTLQSQGLDTFYYGNFNEDNSRWTTTDHRPRFGLDYVSLRGRISILSEAYAYISFEDRIKSTHSFVTECLNFMAENATTIKQTLAQVDQKTISRGASPDAQDRVAINAKVVPFLGKTVVKGFDPPQRPRVKPEDVATGQAPQPPGSPHDYEVDFYGKFEPANRVTRPFAYLIPPELENIVKQLELHGIEYWRLSERAELDVEVYRCDRIEREEKAFQKHQLVSVSASKHMQTKSFDAGTFVVPTSQRLGNLLIYLLELESDDGLVTWNFYDDHLTEGEDFPIVRLKERVQLNSSSAPQR